MRIVLLIALVATTAQGQATHSANPVADATRSWLALEAKNLIAAGEEMPADKYAFQSTPQQMTFAHLMAHIGESNRVMCSSLAGEPMPKGTGASDKSDKNQLVGEVRASFEYCERALSTVDDSALGEEIPLFHRTRANLMMFLTADLADHYATAAMYLRLNGLLPPTATPKK
jgi:uncharacterized damage-inducible protein DinB